MDNQFFTWSNFVESFGREMRIAEDIFSKMVKAGLKENCLCRFDFTFISNREEPLLRLSEFLSAHYPYETESPQAKRSRWELDGKTDEIAVTADNLMYWALDMAKRGYEFDAEFDAYGALYNTRAQTFPELTAEREDFWFDLAVSQYEAGNLSGALISWSHVISINRENADAFYSRAIVKNELHTWKAALCDYDTALKIAPHFYSALVNRGSLKDDHGDHQGAIDDYDQVIRFAAEGNSNRALAYYNRGNSKFHLGDKADACADWKTAQALGADYAQARIAEHCGSLGSQT